MAKAQARTYIAPVAIPPRAIHRKGTEMGTTRNSLLSPDNAMFAVLIAAFVTWTIGSVAEAASPTAAGNVGTCTMIKLAPETQRS